MLVATIKGKDQKVKIDFFDGKEFSIGCVYILGNFGGVKGISLSFFPPPLSFSLLSSLFFSALALWLISFYLRLCACILFMWFDCVLTVFFWYVFILSCYFILFILVLFYLFCCYFILFVLFFVYLFIFYLFSGFILFLCFIFPRFRVRSEANTERSEV